MADQRSRQDHRNKAGDGHAWKERVAAKEISSGPNDSWLGYESGSKICCHWSSSYVICLGSWNNPNRNFILTTIL